MSRNLGADSICTHESSGGLAGEKYLYGGLGSIFPENERSAMMRLCHCVPAAIQWPFFSALLGLFSGLVSWPMVGNATVTVPAWLAIGWLITMGTLILPLVQSGLLYQIDSLGLRGSLHRARSRIPSTRTSSNAKAKDSQMRRAQLEGSYYLLALHTSAPRPDLDEHPLISKDGGKDWFRLMQKATLDTVSSKDVSNCSIQQLHLLLQPLLLLKDFEFARNCLGERLTQCNSLAAQAVCLTMSEQADVDDVDDAVYASRRDFLETKLGPERVKRWESHLKFYHGCCSQRSFPQTLTCDMVPTGLLSPFTGSSAPVEQLTLEKRFSTVHGPVVIKLGYQTLQTVEEHNLSKGDTVEAFVGGRWRHGTIMQVTENSFHFRDACDKEHKDILPQNIRPWPETLLLKPDTVINDRTCFRMFRIFNYLWRHSFIPEKSKPCALDPEVLPAGPKFGFIEYVESSLPVAEFDWMELYDCNEEQLQVFLRTAAGSLIAGHVLGIGDRHEDNMMVRKVSLPKIGNCIQFFQLDFKHCCGVHSPIDSHPISMPRKMKEVLNKINPASSVDTGISSDVFNKGTINSKFDELLALCGTAFLVLRRSNSFVMHFFRLLNRDPELAARWETHFKESLCLQMKEGDAVRHICNKVKNSPHALAKLLKDISHQRNPLRGQAKDNNDSSRGGQNEFSNVAGLSETIFGL